MSAKTPFDIPNPAPGEPPVLTVSELNRMARRALETQLPLMWVEGEVSNFTAAQSGHWYFSLKDDKAQVRCVMFRGRNQFADFIPGNGDHVEIRALPSLYEARGEFQLGVESIRQAGAGRLYEAFLRLRAKLAAEGLFDPARKRVLPAFPSRIGIVTSPRGAALHDVLSALARRMPGLAVIIYPTPVQGQGAAAQIAEAIRTAARRAECDVLLVCRGGGAIEDLWAFNDEAVARAIAASPMPVVSGIGHETDFTIADFAADLRAPTPTAAAELASPDRRTLSHALLQLGQRLRRALQRAHDDRAQRLDLVARGLVHPAERVARQRERLATVHTRLAMQLRSALAARRARLDTLQARLPRLPDVLTQQRAALEAIAARLGRARAASFARRSEHLARLAGNLAHLNPDAVLERGYAIATDAAGRIVRDATRLAPGDPLTVRVWHGRAHTEVKSTQPD
jgi:exodeoxyribonuclease VII large subunit